MMGDVNLLPAEPFEATQIISPSAVRVGGGDYYNQMQELINQDNVDNVISAYYSFQNEEAEKKRVLVYGNFLFWRIINPVPGRKLFKPGFHLDLSIIGEYKNGYYRPFKTRHRDFGKNRKIYIYIGQST